MSAKTCMHPRFLLDFHKTLDNERDNEDAGKAGLGVRISKCSDLRERDVLPRGGDCCQRETALRQGGPGSRGWSRTEA
jgi:hypothetical protein